MKPTIYYLDDKIGHGKANVIRGLLDNIEKEFNFNIRIKSYDLRNDIMSVISIGSTKIGIISHENPHQSPRDLLSLLVDKKCDLIICTSINRAIIDRAISSYVVKGYYQSNYIKSIWSPYISIKQLLNYEISKLTEIISLHVDSKDNLQSEFGLGSAIKDGVNFV